MQSRSLKLAFKVKTEQNEIHGSALRGHLNRLKREHDDINGSDFPGLNESCPRKYIDINSLAEQNHSTDDEDARKQLVVYDPAANGAGEIVTVPDPVGYEPQRLPRHSFPNQNSRVLPSVGAFTVQCANCFKWRLIPTKEKYEEIREHILEQPFMCETAREWRPEISCDDPPDISQDGSRLWAIDKPNIAQPPPGWQRLLRIRGEGSSKFADVYYVAPSGKRLRSTVEIQKYLQEHPEYVSKGVNMSQFSFQIPRPLQENYVRKRPTRLASSHDASSPGMSGSVEPSEVVHPIAWADPEENTNLQLGEPGVSTPCSKAPILEPVIQTPKKKARRTPSKRACHGDSMSNQHNIEVGSSLQP